MVDARVCGKRGGTWNQKEKTCKYEFKSYGQISKQYSTNLKRHYNEQDKVRDKLKRLERKQERLDYDHPFWTEDMIEPMAEAMVKKLPDRTYNILGPFGMAAETSIHFYKKGVTEKNRFEGDNCVSITFRPGELDEGELKLIDYTQDTGQSVNNMDRINRSTASIPKTADAKWLIDYMLKQEKESK